VERVDHFRPSVTGLTRAFPAPSGVMAPLGCPSLRTVLRSDSGRLRRPTSVVIAFVTMLTRRGGFSL
jgi:hypothetical protein